ncbi:4-demethylwyosine synthase TYW1 [Methanobacterium paludis]|uniref:S-adenosyl-L-methionine-dependent tRNA 4-demethylwyosine synthase n=1 Tax=Methanobacterium paludis (strain DSM 25820 / JCM 18151 / SWAN1) TaxID=868131 RepID=F6D1Y3_METPW|nr:4-demethylwyosine synthase TYW1 [Methanobacterium paludis]AEG17272.1 Wyosine base formation domain-containing protein [Methanobacterium paludis]
MLLSDKDIQNLEKKGYRFAGNERHAAAKVCHWTRKSLVDEGVCYKEKFYGIQSHRCLQMSPSIPFCHQKCLFCWRDVLITGTTWNEDFDEPKKIIDDCIDAQRNLLCGYFGNSKVNMKKLKDAQEPNNAAISLAGEPMLYPKIEGLIEEFKRRDFTTFLVTNGMTPSKLKNMETEPTQLYLSVDAPNKDVYKKLCDPQVDKGWERLNKSLDLLSSFKCRTVIRTTCVKGYNMLKPEEYADIIERSNPDFVEIKAYMYVGSSRERLKLENMPFSSDIHEFAESVAKLCGREIVNESRESRVLLLS